MWYGWSWRDLRRRANAGPGLLNKPEITPPSHSYHLRDGTLDPARLPLAKTLVGHEPIPKIAGRAFRELLAQLS